MRIAARAKINWTLDITGQREDGYHLMDMLMQPVTLCDMVTLAPADKLTLTCSGDPLLPGYLAWRIRVTEKKLDGLRSASAPDEEAIARCLHHIAIFKEALIQC